MEYLSVRQKHIDNVGSCQSVRVECEEPKHLTGK